MRIAFGSDHAGFELKTSIIPVVAELGHTIIDVGAFDTSPSDYPDFAEAIGREILDADRRRRYEAANGGERRSDRLNTTAQPTDSSG